MHTKTTTPNTPLRLAALADVHGNVWALEAVLADIKGQDVQGYVLLGDLVADGPAPVRTLERLRALPNTTIVRGNTDRYLSNLGRVVAPRAEMPDLMATWQWAADRLGEEERRFLGRLPTEAILKTPAGQILATHGVPGNDEGWISPKQAGTWDGMEHSGARLLLVGHTHTLFIVETGTGLAIVNPGSVGISPSTGWRANYAILDLWPGGAVSVRHAQVRWDVAAYVAAFEEGIPVNRKARPMLEALRDLIGHSR